MGGGAAGGGWSIGSGVNQGRVEYMGVEIIEWSVDWKALFANYT